MPDQCVICGDAREVLAHYDWTGREVLITDPPYAIVNTFGESMYEVGGHSRQAPRRMQFSFDEQGAALPVVLEALGLCFPRVNSYHVFCDVEHYGAIAAAARNAGLTPKPWARVKLCPPAPMPGNWWTSGWECAQYGYRSGAGAHFGDQSAKRPNWYVADAYRHGIRASEKEDHPTQKWLPMIRYLVRTLCRKDAIVLDPFCGSGTTLVAAAEQGLEAVGIESDPKYSEITKRRVRDCNRQLRLAV